MPPEDKRHKAWEFLRNRAQNGETFTIDDLSRASGWTLGNTKTNLSKRLGELVRKEGEQFHVRPEVLRVQYEEFADLFGQKRSLFAEYARNLTRSVLVYEFFMPLAHEGLLREALDNLFYRDPVEQRIREIGQDRIREELNLPDTLSDSEVEQYVIQFIQDTIGGYSLSLVSGRFRIGSISTWEDVASRSFTSGRYLVDETTAVVRFILPVDIHETPIQRDMFEPTPIDAGQAAAQVRWLFLSFFAEAIVSGVNKEDEIWLLESGMESALYRWVRRK